MTSARKPHQLFVSSWRQAHAAMRTQMAARIAAGTARLIRAMRDGALYEVLA